MLLWMDKGSFRAYARITGSFSKKAFMGSDCLNVSYLGALRPSASFFVEWNISDNRRE